MKMIAEKIGSPLTVGMGRAKFVKIGNKANLNSGPLTFCTSMVSSVHINGKRVGTIMVHQGNNSHKELRTEIYKEIQKEMDYIGKFKLVDPIVQTASCTIIDNEDRDTVFELAAAVDGFIEVEEIFRNREVGPGIGPLQTQMTARIDETGNIDVPRRKGMFECVVS